MALLVVVSLVALQLYFLVRIAMMAIVDPQSTTFQRSEAWRLSLDARPHRWHQQWTDYPAISANLKRAVIAAEDSGFTEHSGVEWDALCSVKPLSSAAMTARLRLAEMAG